MEASLQNDEFLSEITEAVQFVAVREGFSLVLEKSKISALYVSDEVDITEEILEHLYSSVGKKYP
jgi:Skp family chaperone for outer membrane proteins